MSYTETKFAEAVELLQQLDIGGSAQEKRRAKRALFRVQVGIKLDLSDASGAWEKCELRDLSPRGMRVLSRQSLEEGSTFIVQFPADPSGVLPAPLICRGAYCDRQRDGSFLVGAEFTGRVSETSNNSEVDAARIRKSILG